MTPLERAGLLAYWDDTRLRGGDDWYDEIDRALRAASVAVRFISQDFIASLPARREYSHSDSVGRR
ncbi:TIR domain-containing protein [Accumulibacter sp.]|uniref:TIR domain-containing protein n=1 Tax=Accumulibacter sp. TaxID=2053492 RepID=UPI003436A953